MKKVLISGGSRGIGAETVKVFAEKGYSVYFTYNKNQQKAEKLKTDLVFRGFDVHTLKCDLRDENSVLEVANLLTRFAKHIDVLVNNAGVALYKQLQDTSISEFDEVIGTNLKGTFLLTKHILPLLNSSESPSIVNVSSIWGEVGASCESIYSMTKAGIIGFTKSLDKELQNVNCKYICPSLVKTDMCKDLSENDILEFEKSYKVESVEEVAKEIYRLATDGKR